MPYHAPRRTYNRRPRPYAGVRITPRGIRPYSGISCALVALALVALPTIGAFLWRT